METQIEVPLKNKIAKSITNNKGDIISAISEIVYKSKFKFSKLINQYDNYTYLFMYDTENKLCYNIDILPKNLEKKVITSDMIDIIAVNYNQYVDSEGNFISE